MKLRRPQEQIAGCCWLPRLADKARLYLGGRLPFLYRVAFGSRFGVDGHFLRHFNLSCGKLVAGVNRAANDDDLARWFVSLPGVSPQRIADWNVASANLGVPGHAGYLSRQLVKWVRYPRSVGQPVRSLFEAIEQDEGTGPFATPRGG